MGAEADIFSLLGRLSLNELNGNKIILTKIKYRDIVQLRNGFSQNKINKKIYFFTFCERLAERFKIKGENVMRITELLRKSSIALQVDVQSKEEIIDYLVDLISQSGIIPDKEEYKQGILLRESLGTTAIGDEIAIPHAQLDSIMALGIAAITVKNGVNYDVPDGQDVKLCFIITAPKTFYWSVSWLSGTFFLKETFTRKCRRKKREGIKRYNI